MADFEKTTLNRVRRIPDRGIYDRDEIYAIVDAALICHVGIVEDGRPFVIPTIHGREGDTLYLHGAKASRLLKQIAAGEPVCITVTHLDGLVLARSVFESSMNYRSAVLFGRGSLLVAEREKLHALEVISDHLMPGRWQDARLPTPKEVEATSVVAIAIESASAKTRSAPPSDLEEDYALGVWAGVLPIQQQILAPVDDPRLANGITVPGYVRDAVRAKWCGMRSTDKAEERNPSSVPQAFARTISDVHGAVGVAWLAMLPELIDEYAARWSLTVMPPFPLSYNYVAPAVRADGARVVLKLGVPNPLLLREIEALRLYGGHGAAHLLDSDAERGVLLIERIAPGMTLAELEDDDKATAIAAGVMSQLWPELPQRHVFPSVTEWTGGLAKLRKMFAGGTGPLPVPIVEMAEGLFADLIASSSAPVLVHADLHHFNILSAERAPWLALDPQGIAAEREYEVGALLRNPFRILPPAPELRRIEARRIDQLTELLGFDRKRLAAWGMAQAILSAWWDIEDHGAGWETGIAYAEALAALAR